jgi:hypothetical protein
MTSNTVPERTPINATSSGYGPFLPHLEPRLCSKNRLFLELGPYNTWDQNGLPRGQGRAPSDLELFPLELGLSAQGAKVSQGEQR